MIGEKQSQSKPILSFCVRCYADSEWIPAFAGMTKKNISVNRCKSCLKEMLFEKTKPILSFCVRRSADSEWIPAFAGMTKNKYQCQSV
ncbi:MAG TPA: hypothetical protein DIU00_24480 [Phycisphaerales bacterium]|nr:hypothetical protein [Phycisphaerales bacterium]